MVPAHWYPNDPQVVRLWEALAELGIYVAFHCGIFFDGRESSYCRPTFYEAVHQAPNFKGHLAHVGWPWVDECIAVLKIGARFLRIDPTEWGLIGGSLVREPQRLAARDLAARPRQPAA